MKTTLLSVLFAALLLTACSQNDAPNEPAAAPDATQQIAAQIDRLNLTLDQADLLEEMMLMEEDMSLLLDPVQEDALDVIIGDRRFDIRLGPDFAILVYYQLIVKANPELGEETLATLREMIAQYLQLRKRVLNSDLTPEQKRAKLQEEHNKLIRQINQVIGPEAVARVERLKAQLEQKRDERREEYRELRIERQITEMKRLLDLTESEAAAVKRILMLQYEEMGRIRAEYGDNPEKLREALQALRARIDAMMTNAIGAKWERWKQYRQKRIDPPDPGSAIEMRLKMLTDMLQLTERQAAAVKDILTRQQEEMRKLVAQYGNDRAKLAEALKALQERIDAQIVKLLTPEQLERWKRLKSSGGTGTRG